MTTQPINYDKLYNEARKRFFEKSQVYTLDRKAENLAYMIALESGLRVSDLLTLKYEDISFSPELKTYIFTTWIKKTKNNHCGIISNELYSYIETFKDAIGLEIGKTSDYIFYNYKSNSLYSRQWLHKRIKLIGEKLGFQNYGVHSIRKASAIRILDKTGSMSVTQYHLSHKRATTTDKYLNVSKKSALQILAKAY